jgi:hypothetical protein
MNLADAFKRGLPLVLAFQAGQALAVGHEDAEVERAGDYMQVGIPLVALGLTYLLGDDERAADSSGALTDSRTSPVPQWPQMNGSARHDLMLAIGRTELATYSLKYSIDEQRPNGGGQSFPSGHTSISFAGAEFIRKQYGWGWGIPSYAAASYVGWSRVETHNHWTLDVLAGAAIGIFSNHDALDFTLPWGQLSINPSLVSAGAGAFDPPDSSTRENAAPCMACLVHGLRLEVRF